MKVIYRGKAIPVGHINGEKTDEFALWEWCRIRDDADWDLRERMDRYVTEGVIADNEGRPLTGAELERVRHRLLGTYDHMPEIPWWLTDSGRLEERKWLIPDLWPWGTIPMLGGQPKAGKTTLAVELVTALVTYEYRFLGSFEPCFLGDFTLFPYRGSG